MGLTIEYIDGQTPLSEEEKEGLKISSITTREELDEFEQLNIEKAIQWTFGKKLKAEQLLSEKFIKALHKKMYGDVWKWAGAFRNSEKNLGIKTKKAPSESQRRFPHNSILFFNYFRNIHSLNLLNRMKKLFRFLFRNFYCFIINDFLLRIILVFRVK